MSNPLGCGVLGRLQSWYESQCDGDWEHSYGVKITTLDNPGWLVKIDLQETALVEREFVPVQEGMGDQESRPWFTCSVKSQQFVAACSPDYLEHVLGVFLNWAERQAEAKA